MKTFILNQYKAVKSSKSKKRAKVGEKKTFEDKI